jgi:uncharacterized membrane protein
VDGGRGPVRVSGGRATALTAVVVVAGLLGTMVITGWMGSTIPFVVLLLGLVLLGGLRRLRSFSSDAPAMGFVLLVIGTALMLVIGLDIVRVQGDIDRMNSVFKFYVQVWVLLAVASAYLLWRLVSMRKAISPSRGR